jgi:phosphoadenosine phosphosulfate reductase
MYKSMIKKEKRMNTQELNRKYTPLSPEQRISALCSDFQNMLFTSSFGVTSAYLLHLFSRLNPGQPVYFLETTYHFPETIEYKKELTELLHLTVIDLKGEAWRNEFTRTDRTWEKDPDLCCSVNKVEPLEKIKTGFSVWISGLRKTQSEHRKELSIFEETSGILKFYPILDQTEEQVSEYIQKYNLPEHPLKSKGFESIGCMQCTAKGTLREGRWINKSKTECGLHM